MKIKLNEFFYLSNILSICRIILVIPFTWLMAEDPPGSIFWLTIVSILIILTDYLDGYFARKLKQVSDLGIVLDPIADKIVMAIGLIMLIIYRKFPVPLVIFVIYRDVMIIILGWFTLRKLNKPVMANFLGKLNTSVFAVAGFLSVVKVDNILFTITVVCAYSTTLISGISYGMVGARLLFVKKLHKVIYWIGIAVLTGAVLYFSSNFNWI